MKVFVYTLADPRDAESVRYVGICLNPRRRLASHLSQCERGRTRRANWVRKVKRAGLVPVMAIVEEVDGPDWGARERAWIVRLRGQGYDLVNANEGGRGGLNPSAETRQKMSDARRRYYQGVSPAVRQAIGERLRSSQQNMSPSQKEILAARRAVWTRQNMIRLRSAMTPESRSEAARRGHETRKANGTKVVRKLCNKGHPLEPGNIVYECGGKVRRCATCFITKQERSRAKQRQQKS